MFSYLTTLKNPIAPKSGLISPGNNAQPLPKQLQKNFEKGQKMTSFVAELAKITITGMSNFATKSHFLSRLSTFRAGNIT